MDEFQLPARVQQPVQEPLLYFWALGDMHYYNNPAWQMWHTPRLDQMFQDLRQLWIKEGWPTFCVSPGDIVEVADPAHYQLAREEVTRNLEPVPFYPGLGNHELFSTSQESTEELLEDFSIFWEKPPRYYWVEGEVLCVMLDVVGYGEPILTEESLEFLEHALAKHPRHIAVIFAHCPLYGTVQDRDSLRNLDYDSLEPFFYLENSAEVRAVLGRHTNACLYLSGHTHSGWQAPNFVATEQLGGHLVTFANLSSPWYSGRHHGVMWLDGGSTCIYRPDDPDVIVSMAIQVSRARIQLRLRDHRAGSWLAEWSVPVG